jgi:type I restriction enzyme R subunit
LETQALVAQVKRKIDERLEQDAALYRKFSQLIEAIISDLKARKINDALALGQLRLLDEQLGKRQDHDLPEKIRESGVTGGDIIYRNLKTVLTKVSEVNYQRLVLALARIVNRQATIDWRRSFESERQMREHLDDYLYDEAKSQPELNLTEARIQAVIERILKLAENNRDVFGRE